MADRRRILTRDEVVARLEAAIVAQGGLGRFCRRHALSETFVSNVRYGRKAPTDTVLGVLGLEKSVTTYVHVYEVEATPDVAS